MIKALKKIKKLYKKTLFLYIKIKKEDENIKKQDIKFKLLSNKIIK